MRWICLAALSTFGCGDEFQAHRSRGPVGSGGDAGSVTADAGSAGEDPALGIRDASSFPCTIGAPCSLGPTPSQGACLGGTDSTPHFELCGWPESGMGCQATDFPSDDVGAVANCQPVCVTGADCESGCCTLRAACDERNPECPIKDAGASIEQYLCQPVGYEPGPTNSQCVED